MRKISIRKYCLSASLSGQYTGAKERPGISPTPHSWTFIHWDCSWNLKPYWCESPKGHSTALASVQCLSFSSSRVTFKKSFSHHKFSIFFFYSNPKLEKRRLNKWGYSFDFKIGMSFLLQLRLLSWGGELNAGQTGCTGTTGFNKLTCQASVPQAFFPVLVVTCHNSRPSCSFHTEGCLFIFYEKSRVLKYLMTTLDMHVTILPSQLDYPT